jgi:hypothetical protein
MSGSGDRIQFNTFGDLPAHVLDIRTEFRDLGGEVRVVLLHP